MKLKKLAAAAITAATLGLSSAANAAIIADVMWIVDTSGSMGSDIAEVKQRIIEFNAAMTANSIDARYGLVRFGTATGGTPSLIQDITDFATFTAAGSPFQLLTANGGSTEDGSAAIQTALSAAFRPDTVRNIILITDEDDDDAANRAALTAALAGTVPNELINIIGNPNDDSNDYYNNLAPNNGGQFFDILDFRDDPDAFFTNFVNTKVTEILDDFCAQNPNDPQCTRNVPEPNALALLGLGLSMLGIGALRRRKV